MPRSKSNKLKLLYIKDILMENTDDDHGLTLSQIQNKLEDYGISAERKSLYDDFDALTQYGLDIQMDRVGGKTVYHIGCRDFEISELKLLVDAVQSSKLLTKKKSTELIKKLSANTSIHQKKLLDRQVYVSNRIKAINESILITIDHIHTAISENKKLTFQYFEWNAKKERVLRHDGALYKISPFALTWDDENYYMIGFDTESDCIKHYRVDKMQTVTVTNEPRDGGKFFKKFDLAIYSRQMFGMFGGEKQRVTLQCDNSLAGVIIDRFGEDLIISTGKDKFSVTVTVNVSNIFLSWVMGFGSKMKITYPEDVKNKIKDLAGDVLQQY